LQENAAYVLERDEMLAFSRSIRARFALYPRCLQAGKLAAMSTSNSASSSSPIIPFVNGRKPQDFSILTKIDGVVEASEPNALFPDYSDRSFLPPIPSREVAHAFLPPIHIEQRYPPKRGDPAMVRAISGSRKSMEEAIAEMLDRAQVNLYGQFSKRNRVRKDDERTTELRGENHLQGNGSQ